MALSNYARRKVWERDKGVCALCGGDTAKVMRIIHLLRLKNEHEAARLLYRAWGMEVNSWWGWPKIPWEADHMIPLVEGGTHELSNYRTLCRACHKSETRLLAKRRAEARRGFAGPLLHSLPDADEEDKF